MRETHSQNADALYPPAVCMNGLKRIWPYRSSTLSLKLTLGLSISSVPECTGTSVTLWTGDIRYKSLAELRA